MNLYLLSTWLRARVGSDRDERGLTLIEFMVVALILIILAVIVISVIHGVQHSSRNE